VIDRSLKKDAKAAKTLLQQMINIIRYRREVRQGIELLGGAHQRVGMGKEEEEEEEDEEEELKKKKKKKSSACKFCIL
jgi:predicted ribosome quality control (RQC) complex YloA/Tae2 family protein